MTSGDDVGNAKRTVRARCRDVRAAIAVDPADRARRSASICTELIAAIEPRMSSVGSLHVLVFEALPGEPDLADLAGWCAANDVVTYVPVVNGDALGVGPGDADPIVLDVVVVPGLAFTTGGDRLGQGGGHFDRFLLRLRGDCLRVGVAFREQLAGDLPTADHDVAVDLVITD